jgi:hypothetical protein
MRVVLVLVALLAACLTQPLTAQCTAYGQPCTSSGMLAICSNSPVVGGTWTLGERSGTACGFSSTTPGTMFTLLGDCFQPGIPVDPPVSCANCGGCFLHVLPIWAAYAWTWPPRTTTLTIPSDPNLVGATFCMQDVCFNAGSSCVCMSAALQVVIQ